jgi:hypothetical protein
MSVLISQSLDVVLGEMILLRNGDEITSRFQKIYLVMLSAAKHLDSVGI